MAGLDILAGNHGPGSQNVKTNDGPQNNNNGQGTQTNNYTYHVGPKETSVDEVTILQKEKEKEKEDCLRSLSFEYMDARKEDISLAHPQTCDWFFETSQFQQWYRRDNLQNHNGVLWIKGHPGTGKSTLMKHTLRHLEETLSKTHITAAHFFNARGDYSEQTPLSMLRSLLFQLLEKEPSIYEQFVLLFRNKKQKFNTNWKWREQDLKNFLVSNIQHCQSNPLVVLIDALDECEVAHVRNVVGLLEELSIKAIGVGVTLNICLSSRHYPHIGMRKHLELVVEKTSEHNEDIVLYTRDNLRINDKEMEKELLEKASGVFMWAVLVITLLNKAYDEGQIEVMHKTLHDVPRDLEQVFETLIFKGNSNEQETVFMLQFVLVAKRLLTPEELYFATLAETSTEKINPWDQSKITLDAIQRRITNSSRGLIEIRKSKNNAVQFIRKSENNAVQFIHKSVNDYLTRNKRLGKLDPSLIINGLGSSHERLKSCCMAYIMQETFQLTTDRKQAKALGSSYPFLEYASIYVLAHAEEADKNKVGQADFLQRLLEEPDTLETMRLFHNAFEQYPGSGCARGASLLYMLAFHEYSRLTKALLNKKKYNINSQGGIYGYALHAAAVRGNKEIVRILLEAGADVNAKGGFYTYALHAAVEANREESAEILLKAGADVNANGEYFGYALHTAAFRDNKELVKLLLEAGADVNAKGGIYTYALHAAAKASKEMVEILLKAGADVNAKGGIYGYALYTAAEFNKKENVEILLKAGANVNAQGGAFGCALYAAANESRQNIMELLLEKGADVNAPDGPVGSALSRAASNGYENIVKILLEAGADINAQGGPYGNALCAAVIEGKADIVQLLLEKGADVDSKTAIYGNALQAATIQKNEEIMALLIQKGANTNLPDSYFNVGLQDTIISKTEGQLLEMLLKQRIPVAHRTKRKFQVFFRSMLRATIYEDTMEILFKEILRADNQWIYDSFCWLAMKGNHFDDAARLAEKGAIPNSYIEGFPIGLAAAMALKAQEVMAVFLDKGVATDNLMFYTEVEAEDQMFELHSYPSLAWLVLGIFSTIYLILCSYLSIF